jgi:hypothetical protein
LPIHTGQEQPSENKGTTLFSRITTGDFLQIGLMVFGLVSFAIHIQDRQDQASKDVEALKAELTRTEADTRRDAQTVQDKILDQLKAYHNDNASFQLSTDDRLTNIIGLLQNNWGLRTPPHH